MSMAGICFCAEALPIPTLLEASQVDCLFVTIGVRILNIDTFSQTITSDTYLEISQEPCIGCFFGKGLRLICRLPPGIGPMCTVYYEMCMFIELFIFECDSG